MRYPCPACRVWKPNKPGGFIGYTRLKKRQKNSKNHFNANCIVLFNNMFRYFEVLKPISRTLLIGNIFRYSKVLVSILKPKTQKGPAAYSRQQLANKIYQPYLFHISDFSTIRYNGLFYIFTVSLTALLFTIPCPSQEWFIILVPGLSWEKGC